MFANVATLASILLAASSVLAAPTYRRADIPDRADWKNQNLESYYRFRTRYKNLGCADPQVQANDFYNQCCLPLPKGQEPAEQCTPSWCSAPAVTSSSSVSVEDPATSPATTTTVVASQPAATTPVPTPTPTPVEEGDEEDDDDDYDWVCEDDDDETTSIAPTTTTTSTPAPAPTEVDDGDYDDDEDDDDDIPFCDEVGDDYEPITTTTTSPQETSTPAPAPETTTSAAPEPTTTAQADNGNNNNGNADVQSGGFATFYYQGGNPGACGDYSSDSDLIGAIDQDRYGYDFGVVSSECGRRVRVTNTNNGKTVDITIKDVCPTCVNRNSIDLSKGAFLSIAAEADGMVPISWSYI